MAFADTFKALSDPVHREILQLLKSGPPVQRVVCSRAISPCY